MQANCFDKIKNDNNEGYELLVEPNMHKMPASMGSFSLSSSHTGSTDVQHSENSSGMRTEISKVTSNQGVSRISFNTTEEISVYNEKFSGFVNNAILITVLFLFLFLGCLAIPFICLLRRKARYTIKKFIRL
ncbi:conserved Plasmodium chabaudi protein, unknown function [Plasmodium chabaudi chabaudi]|uniref:Uncharacterized protein n=1 Tax=Plasmodium chabaudi chabaudi TaxID=31271 RepID=A0A077THA4_PLACU|nr:conserved Plasmodium chabaudi protein, unknown function [Plasmodium chabaudi chabaudi]SCL93165.1 conserved Plasmodium chabaudi protein, unknown function [Plasmodium chabaudi chabaudi]VTZ67136.1 conserved Plasmodium chabaudi protein, unknown function [Plasmodium chabaudi chabaudi]|eukprot:XP_016653245.1 conserved Plasmodium chabaudi protein, unknown function [Plasmodium chabaudi chabaudi]